MLKTILLAVSMSMTIGIYYPLFKRILKRKATRDFSKTAQTFIMLVQINGFALATAEHAPYLQIWYIIQTILTALNLYFIYRYWNTVPPLLRATEKKNG